MVASFLQSDLADELRKVLDGFRLMNPLGEIAGINVFEQRLPMPELRVQEEIPPELLENGLAEEQADPDPYPYVIVRVEDGEIKDESSAQTVNVTLLIGTYDPESGKQGHKDILSIIAKIYERFAKVPVLGGKYTIQYPILWSLQEEESYPFYVGGMYLSFETAAVVREDKYS